MTTDGVDDTIHMASFTSDDGGVLSSGLRGHFAERLSFVKAKFHYASWFGAGSKLVRIR